MQSSAVLACIQLQLRKSGNLLFSTFRATTQSLGPTAQYLVAKPRTLRTASTRRGILSIKASIVPCGISHHNRLYASYISSRDVGFLGSFWYRRLSSAHTFSMGLKGAASREQQSGQCRVSSCSDEGRRGRRSSQVDERQGGLQAAIGGCTSTGCAEFESNREE